MLSKHNRLTQQINGSVLLRGKNRRSLLKEVIIFTMFNLTCPNLAHNTGNLYRSSVAVVY